MYRLNIRVDLDVEAVRFRPRIHWKFDLPRRTDNIPVLTPDSVLATS